MSTCFSHRCIIPPDILKNIARNGTPQQRSWALNELQISSYMRGQRKIMGLVSLASLAPGGGKRRTIYDAAGEWSVHGTVARQEGDKPSRDPAVNEAYDGSGATWTFFNRVFGRSSIDGNGMRLDSTVHYGEKYANAFWNGMQMVYGDGDGEIFNRFTSVLDIIAHELTHGVTQFEAGLEYEAEPGALNEHFSDVFGSLVKQYAAKQTAETADWLIGAGVFTKKIRGAAVRSMKNPGTAYDDPLIGKDEQPAHMRDYVHTADDHGGVHLNSGIPNKAFCNLALALGGQAWKIPGSVWYITLRDRLRPDSDFLDCAAQTHSVAGEVYGAGSEIQKAVAKAWASVGLGVPAATLQVPAMMQAARARLIIRSAAALAAGKRSGVSPETGGTPRPRKRSVTT